MKVYKGTLRVLTLVFFLILALVGIGIVGAIPLLEMKRKQEKEITIEQVDEQDENLNS